MKYFHCAFLSRWQCAWVDNTRVNAWLSIMMFVNSHRVGGITWTWTLCCTLCKCKIGLAFEMLNKWNTFNLTVTVSQTLFKYIYLSNRESKLHPSRKCIPQQSRSPSHSSATLRTRRCPGPWGRWGSPGCASRWARPASSHTWCLNERMRCVKTTYHCTSVPVESHLQSPQLCSLWEPRQVAPIHHCLSHLTRKTFRGFFRHFPS